MNLNLLHLLQMLRRVTGNLKISGQRATFLSTAVKFMVIPIGMAMTIQPVDATLTNLPANPVEVQVTLKSDLNLADKTYELQVGKSEYQLQKEADIAKAQKIASVAKATAKITYPQGEPSPAEKRAWVEKAAAKYGISANLLEAVWQVESGKTWNTSISSYAGASGPCQFMPGTWRGYAEDGNGDGYADINLASDCLFGSAKLLARNGAAAGDINRALFAYNHSMAYVNKVKQIAGM